MASKSRQKTFCDKSTNSYFVFFALIAWVVWLAVVAGLVSKDVPKKQDGSVDFEKAKQIRLGLVILSPVVAVLVLLLGGCITWVHEGSFKPWKKYDRNLANTLIVLLTAVAVLPALYWKLWYPERTREVIILERDRVTEEYFPSITLLQQDDWSSQADLDDSSPPKCFIGRYDEQLPDCGTVFPGSPCKCHNRWGGEVIDYEWQNSTYRTITLTPSESMISRQPAGLMIAQAFFNYNSTKARINASQLLPPSLWVAIYDPRLPLEEALYANYSQMRLINANGLIHINIRLNSREVPGRSAAYDYDLSLSSIPAMDIQCDVSAPGGARSPCILSLYLQYPNFERLSAKQEIAMSWGDLLSEAGSWFALFQLLGWILSGAAWHKSPKATLPTSSSGNSIALLPIP
ncbi:hypothetical protein QBC38DRAFT_80874 [Podospora fimiseda]|uniref:Uncharacterized protein n=1 Tax=Podospora fimiseda TaxID=252190 RepID=A0AAN6YNJ4_9PEZI|nr:hypothetical protein QBC38DRAFT_80874 [Podospora fimiseda]